MNETKETATATEKLRLRVQHYQASRIACDNALDQCGIGHDVKERLGAGADEIGEFLGKLSARMHGQLHHDLLVNVPAQILHRWQAGANHAIHLGLVGAAGEFVEWDINAALDLASEILDDVNAHAEAQKVREMKRYEQTTKKSVY